MALVKNKTLQKTISIERIIGKIQGKEDGPTIIFFAGIHGNETAGVFALNQVFNSINKEQVKGTIYGVSGNLKALEQNQRFINEDLNRIWLKDNLKSLENKRELNYEEEELKQLFFILNKIINKENTPLYFIDLHTTSSKTLPFITINDALINRKFSVLFPVPIVLGIEEYLDGPLLSYINGLGYVSLGFESGQHDEKSAIINSVAFIYLALAYAEIINEKDIPNFNHYVKQLKKESQKNKGIYEVIYLHRILNGEKFKMKPDFKNFQRVTKGTIVANNNGKTIITPYNAQLFMPLYQEKGKEGFFIIKRIAPFFLKLSELLRKIKADNLFIIFPGVSWENKEKKALLVNLNTAKFMVKPLFHLLGYRNKQIDKTHLKLYNRERVAKNKMYKNKFWYKNK